MTQPPAIQWAADAIGRARIDLSDEKAAQRQIAEVLTGRGIAFEREVALSPGDRPDFLLPDGLVIEVKLRARKMEIWRQLGRYAAHERVRALLLVSNTAMGLPEMIEGKPLKLLSLGRSWL
jgi:hypothetical protein